LRRVFDRLRKRPDAVTPEQSLQMATFRSERLRGDAPDPAVQRDFLRRLTAFRATLPDDPTLAMVAEVETWMLGAALDGDAVDEVRDLALARRPGPPTSSDDDTPGLDLDMALPLVAVLAQMGRLDDAVSLMERTYRWGWFGAWRFRPPQPGGPDKRHHGWLAPLADLPAYQQVTRAHQAAALPATAEAAMIRLVEDATLGGKAQKRCGLSGEKIAPGTAIVRWRPLHGHLRDTMEMASAEAFASSPLALQRGQLETNTVPVADMFPWPPDRRLDAPVPLAAFLYDTGRAPDALDLERAARVLARPGPDPRPMGFKLGPNLFEAEPPVRIAATGHGLAGDLLWMLVRCGQFTALQDHIRALPQAEADQVMALCAAFADADVRAAAAGHFGIPELAQTMEMIFASRARPARALSIANFGTAHPRFRQAMARACAAYGLHLYSGYVPCPNWYYDGWTHLTRGHNTSLMSLFLDHPDELPMLHVPIRRGALPTGLGGTMAAECSDARDVIYQAILLSLCRTAPARAAHWLAAPDDMGRLTNTPAGRAARKTAQALLSQQP
jgi:hypothetical protein